MGSGSASGRLFLAFLIGLVVVSLHGPVSVSLIFSSKTERAIIIKRKYRWQFSRHNEIEDGEPLLLNFDPSCYGGAGNMQGKMYETPKVIILNLNLLQWRDRKRSRGNSDVFLLSTLCFCCIEDDFGCRGCQKSVMQLTENNSYFSETYRAYRQGKNEVIPSIIYSLCGLLPQKYSQMEGGL